MSCSKTLNHVIGCGYDGPVTVYMYLDSGRKHPGTIFNYCPGCGKRIFIDDVADEYDQKCNITQVLTAPPDKSSQNAD